MNKTLLLTRVLHRCSTGTLEGGRRSGGGSRFAFALAAVGCIAFAFLGAQLQALAPILGDPLQMFAAIFLLAAFTAIIFSFTGILNYLYLSDDLQDLLTMPFSARQIICAKVLLASRNTALASFTFIVPTGAAYGIAAGVQPGFYLAVVLAFVCIPVFVSSLIGIVLILAMYFFKGLRNRNTLKILGSIAAFIILLAFYALTQHQTGDIQAEAGTFFQQVADVSMLLPLNNALIGLMGDFSPGPLALAAGTMAVTLAVFLLLVARLYVPGALAMQETASGSVQLDEQGIRDACVPRKLVDSLILQDYRHTSRNPAYLLQGYLEPLILPIVMAILLLVSGTSMQTLSLDTVTAAGGAAAWSVCVSTLVTLTCACVGAIASSAFSREGGDMAALRQMPISAKQLLQAKWRFALALCGMGSTVYIVLGGAVLAILGKIPLWCLPLALFVNVCLAVWATNTALYHDIKKANFVWDDEATAVKNSIGAGSMVLLFTGLVVAIVGYAVLTFVPDAVLAVLGAMCVLILAGALLSTRKLFKKGVALIQRF